MSFINKNDGFLKSLVRLQQNLFFIFDQNSKQITPEVKEGLFRGQELSCLIDVDSTYFYNGNWGLTIRAYQVKTLSEAPETVSPIEDPPVAALTPGVCAFLPIS